MHEEESPRLAEIKAHYKIPLQAQSCHTAIVDGYVIEGHVPQEEILRMLKERPDIIGLSVPGMPIGSPGMEMPDREAEPYQVLALGRDGRVTVYASYPK